MAERPTGREWRNWKKQRGRERARLGLPYAPDDWFAEWESCQPVGSRCPNRELPVGFEVDPLPKETIAVEELLEQRFRQFDQIEKAEEARKLVRVRMKDPGPIAILHFGDPHVDDNGSDLRRLLADADLVARTPGMYGANIGDTTNNWVGKLARLYGQQSTSAAEAWLLAEEFIRRVGRDNWLYMLAGNHDCWSGDSDPIRWISSQAGITYEGHGIRVGLEFPNGRVVTINARHDHMGSSMWNPGHGAKKSLMLGQRDDVAINGHKHESGIGVFKCPETGKVCWGIQVATYKRYDRYAKEKGFRDGNVSPCVVTVINPFASDPNDVVVPFWNPERAASYLTWLRSQAMAG